MAPISLSFDLPAKIAAGLANGDFVRNGGVIQNQAGQVVMWLKETSGATGITPNVLGSVDPTGILKLGLQGVDSAVTHKRLTALGTQVTQLQNLAVLTSATSILTLGVSVAGFAIISKKLKNSRFADKKGSSQQLARQRKIDLIGGIQ